MQKNSQQRQIVSVSYSSKNRWIIEILPEFSNMISYCTSYDLNYLSFYKYSLKFHIWLVYRIKITVHIDSMRPINLMYPLVKWQIESFRLKVLLNMIRVHLFVITYLSLYAEGNILRQSEFARHLNIFAMNSCDWDYLSFKAHDVAVIHWVCVLIKVLLLIGICTRMKISASYLVSDLSQIDAYCIMVVIYEA